MADQDVRDAYSSRAVEYTQLLGSVDQMHESDHRLITGWAESLAPGRVLDAGCGPGHWTALLHRQGASIEGIDLVPEFIDHAQATYPDVPFRLGAIRNLDAEDDAFTGVLAWYSLIHTEPDVLPLLLGELRRVLAPGGGLLLGFFEGAAGEPFPHVVTDAFFWTIDAMTRMLVHSGFEVTATEGRQDPGRRPHAAITAVAR